MPQYYPEEWLDELSNRLDIIDVIGDYVQLKPRGKNHWGLCPFHGEKTPSFSVDSEKQLFYCFGCHKGGNMFRFIMDIENIPFQEAVERLAEKAHMPLPDVSNDKEQQNRLKIKKEKLYELQREAAHYFYNNLKDEDSKVAIQYLKSRKLSADIAKTFGIGYAKDSWEGLKSEFLDKYDKSLLIEAGLVSQKNDRIFDYFRNRIMFPIIDLRGNVVGFGGRILDEGSPKYLNSPESAIFNKKNILYGLNFALKKNRPLARLIIVEGYIDVISLHKVGFTEAVATLGTAFASSHAKLIKRYTDNVYISYDGDKAGQNATLRCIEILLANGISPKVIDLADKKDPDEFISEYGAQAYDEAISNAQTYMDFKLDILKKAYDLSKSENKMEYATEAVKQISKIGNAIERDRYLSRVHVETGYDKEVLERQIVNEIGLSAMPSGNNKVNVIKEAEKASKLQLDTIKAEKYLVCNMARSENDRTYILESINEENFSLPLSKRLYSYIKQMHEQGRKITVASLLNHFSEDESLSQITEIVNNSFPEENRSDFITDCINCIKMGQIEDNMKKIIQQLEKNPEKSKRQELLHEYKELDKQLDKLRAHNTKEV